MATLTKGAQNLAVYSTYRSIWVVQATRAVSDVVSNVLAPRSKICVALVRLARTGRRA